ncbi:MAG: hypothetical protein OHK0022_50060 [Roseiflexaceae bacterium]
MQKIVPIVEGDGEVLAVPSLISRVLEHYGWSSTWYAGGTIRAGNIGHFKKNLYRYLKLADLEPQCGGILVLFDYEDGCPKTEAIELATAIRKLNLVYPISIVLAHREYEAWFLASLSTIAGNFDLPAGLTYDNNVEAIRGVKEWFGKNMSQTPPKAYKPTIHQEPMTKLIDIEVAMQRSRSFQRLVNAIRELVHNDLGVVTPAE